MNEENNVLIDISANNTNENTKTETINSGQNNIKDKYRIYNYFREHPSFFIAFVSAIVAVMSVVLNYIGFLNNNAYLSYFDVGAINKQTSPQFLYFIVFAIAFSVCLLLFQSFISRTFEAYVPYKQRYLLHKYRLSSIRKKNKNNEHRIKKLERRANAIKLNEKNSVQVTEVKNTLKDCSDTGRKIAEEYKRIKKDIRKQRIRYHVLLSISCFVTWFILALMCVLMFQTVFYELYSNILISTLLSAVYVLTTAIGNWFLYCVVRMNKKQIKKDARMAKGERFLSYEDFPEIPLETVLYGNIRCVLIDSNCKRGLFAILYVLVIFIIAAPIIGVKSAERKEAFFVVEENNSAYAVIYNDENTLILEKAEISNNDITIYTTEQMIMDAKGILMKKYNFDNVDLIYDDK